jgi:hypothetical protein
MALIHYYKFNGNLYDSIGTFDLLKEFGTPLYTTGKLGGSTGAVTSVTGSSSPYYIFGCSGSGGAASGFMAADTTEAANGVLSWSITGWVYLTSLSTQLIQLLTGTAGQSTAILGYDHKGGLLTFNGTSAACSSGAWVFFAIRVTGGASYLSVNGGAESMTTWTTNMMAGGKSLFNGIRIGSPLSYLSFYAYLDDVRVFNHSLSSGEIAGIYNGGSPAEATARSSNALTPYRHYKFNSSLADSSSNSPSLSAVVSGLYATSGYTTGLAANTNQSIEVSTPGGGNPTGVYVANSAWYKSTGRNSTDSIAYMWWSSNPSFGSPNIYDRVIAYPFMSLYSGTLTVYHSSGSTNITQPTPLCLHKAVIFDGISKRFTYYENSNLAGECTGELDLTTYYPEGFYAWISSTGSTRTFRLDDMRFYGNQISGIEVLDIYNGGAGTELSPANGTATGAGATIIMSAPAGAAVVLTNGSAIGSGATVNVSSIAGIAFMSSNGSSSGSLPAVTVTTWSGTTSYAYASGLLGTVTVTAISGFSPLASGALGTISVTSFSGQAAGGALSSGALASVTVSSFAGIAFPEFIGTGSLGTVSVTAIEAVASISTSIQLSYCACDAEIGWKQSLPITGFVSAVQGEDAISARITPVVSGTDANIVFFEQRTLTASSSYTYDLRSLTDFLGQSFSLSRAYAISVVMTSGSATISPGASNPLQWFFNSTTANVTITSGNSFMFAQKGSAIVSNSAKTILVTNPSALSACVYKIAILGGR